MSNRIQVRAELCELLKRFCGLDDTCRRFIERQSGDCECEFCRCSAAEFILDDLQALLWTLDKVATSVDSGMPRGGSAPSEN